MESIKHLDRLLGYKVEDKVTGINGIVTSISFDLYGCIQALVTYVKGEESKNLVWIDINRLNVKSDEPVMDQPNYDYGYVAEGKQGSISNKPAR